MNLDDMLSSADTSRVQGGGRSLVDKLSDAATAGVAGATVSALASIYNTGVSVVNLFGAQAEEYDTAKVLGNIDKNWQNYYTENSQVIDTVGFLGGSFIPGGIALAGLKAVRAGKVAGAFSMPLRFTQEKQIEYLNAGLKEIAQQGGNVYSRINSNKLISMAYGAADNALQAAVFEVAAATTMHASPIFANESFGDISWDIAKTALLGGVLGGGVEALFTNKIFRDTGKLVDKSQRKYDAVVQLEKMGLSFGDEVFALTDELFRLPKVVAESDRVIKHSYKMNGKVHEVDLETGGLFDKKIAETTQQIYQTLQAKLTNVVAGDTTIGAPVADSLISILQKGIKAEVPESAIKQQVMDFMGGLKSIEAMGTSTIDFSKEVRYLSPGAKLVPEGKVQDLFSLTKATDKAQGYREIGNVADAKVAVIGTHAATIKQAFADGFDMAIAKEGGNVVINPKSQIWRRVSTETENNTMRRLWNVKTHVMSDSAPPTIADIATQAVPLRITPSGVSAADRTFAFSVDNFFPEQDTLTATARHAWSTELNTLKGVQIDSRDFSLLDRLQTLAPVDRAGVTIKEADGTVRTLDSVGDLSTYVLNNKVSRAQEILDAAKAAKEEVDVRSLAYQLNTEHAWVENAAKFEFDATKLQEGAFKNLFDYRSRENVVMAYDPKIAKAIREGDFASSTLAYEYRKQVAMQKAEEAAAAVLQGDYAQFLDITSAELTGKFDATGVGATGFGFANADYGDVARLWAQDVGKSVSLVSQRRVNAALDKLQPFASELITNPKAGAEAAAILTKIRRSDYHLSLMDGNLVDLVSKEKYQNALKKGDMQAAMDVQFKTMIPMDPKVYAFYDMHHTLHGRQLDDRVMLANAQGVTLNWPRDALYVPPIDTRKVPYFAFVRQKEGRALATSDVAMITARTPQELQELANKVGPDFDVIFKADNELYHKAKGDYDYTRALNSPTLDPYLRKQGKLGDFLPSLDAKATVEDFIVYHTRKEQQITRDAVEVRYGQTFSELSWLSDQNTKIETSKFNFLGKLQQKAIADPFGDYKKTALNISKRSEFTLWHQANEFVDAVGTRAYAAVEKGFQQAKAGEITWEEGNQLMNRMGLGTPFTGQEAFLTAQVGHDRNLIKQAISKGNMLLATLGLRLDAANSLLNIISTPIMLGSELQSIRRLVADDSELAGKIGSLTSNIDPASKLPIPGTTKLIANAIKNYWTPQGKLDVAGRYKDIGAVKDILSIHHEMMADLSLVPNMVPKKWAENVSKWTEKASTLTGNNFAEQFTRFVSADVMRQLTDPVVLAGRMSVKEQNAYISIFVNRVQGNYTASQRPIAFQGTIGAAIGLFQTYQFNMLQQLFRHIEGRDGKAIAVMAGLQTSIFGLNGLPLFDAINTHIIGSANINENHEDAYTFAVKAAGKELGDWMMYGTASAFPFFGKDSPALYSRGDLNPRHLTIIPTSPSQIPVVETGSRVIANLMNTAKQIGNGGAAIPTLLSGLEHNGVSRPLAGIAQIAQGYATTSSGSLISSSSDFSAIATASRFLGARPMDEAVALNTKFRMEAYKAADRDRIEELGAVVKQKIRDGSLTPEDVNAFQGRYAAVGGRSESYAGALQRWSKNATTSVVNTLRESQGTSYGRNMNIILGGEPLQDLQNSPPQAAQQ